MEAKQIILELRVKNGLSQEELAERVYVTRQAVSRWEQGETVPNTETLKRLSKLFDVSINTLLGSPRKLVCQCCGMPLEGYPQQRTGRQFQRGLLQVVLCRRDLRLHQLGTTDGVPGSAHEQRDLATGGGAGLFGSDAAEVEALAVNRLCHFS